MKNHRHFLILALAVLFTACQQEEGFIPVTEISFTIQADTTVKKGKSGARMADPSPAYFTLSHFLMKVGEEYYESNNMNQKFAFPNGSQNTITKFDVFDTEGNLVYGLAQEVSFTAGNTARVVVPVTRPELQEGEMSGFGIEVETVTVPFSAFFNGSKVSCIISAGAEQGNPNNYQDAEAGNTVTIPVPAEGYNTNVDFFYEDSNGVEHLEYLDLSREEVLKLKNLEVTFS